MNKDKAKKVSVIIALLNEEKTIGRIVEKLLTHPSITEIICVLDDGCIDKSRIILKSFGTNIILLDIGKNRGKGYALCAGIEKASGDILLFLDADIINLTEETVIALLKPLHKPHIKAVLGYPPIRHQFAKLFLPLTGERVYYKKDILPHISRMSKVGYGVEMYLNEKFTPEQTAVVKLKNLQLLEKREKHGLRKSFKDELRAMTQLSMEMARREGFLPRDYKVFNQFTRAKNLMDIKETIKTIQNARLKGLAKKVVKAFFLP